MMGWDGPLRKRCGGPLDCRGRVSKWWPTSFVSFKNENYIHKLTDSQQDLGSFWFPNDMMALAVLRHLMKAGVELGGEHLERRDGPLKKRLTKYVVKKKAHVT